MASTQSCTSFSLLFVEDDKIARDIAVRMVGLKFPCCTIHSADNGRKGLDLFKEHTPDVIVTDINMPEMDGIEMARAIKSINDQATCIVLTGYGDKNYFEKFKEIGFCAYLMKPVVLDELFMTIERCREESKVQR
jgi:YesN/AraC family two-component response regulator